MTTLDNTQIIMSVQKPYKGTARGYGITCPVKPVQYDEPRKKASVKKTLSKFPLCKFVVAQSTLPK